jgi:hypothetical protein
MQATDIQVIHTVHTLPLIAFIQALNGDYTALLKSGQATDAELKTIWAALYSDYLELTKETSEYKSYLFVFKKLATEQSILVMLAGAYQSLLYGYNAELDAQLKDRGIDLKIAEVQHDFMAYMDRLKKIETYIKGAKMSLITAQNEYQEYIKKQEKLGDSDYMNYVAAVSKAMGFNIPLETPLIQWVSYCNLFDKMIKNGRRKN